MMATSAVFLVDERELAVKKRFGEIIDYQYAPGVHFKIPFFENVIKFDRRIMTLDTPPERFLTSEKKNVRVDSFIKWKIDNLKKYYISVRDEDSAATRLDQIVKKVMKEEFSTRTVKQVVSDERQEIMKVLSEATNQTAKDELGIQIIDVRIKRVDLPKEVSNSVYRRMRAERERIARDYRSRGAEAAEKIKADADRQRTVTLAEAYRDSEKLRGDGDATAAETYANAFNKNRDFYEFSRSLTAYKNVFGSQSNMMVLKPDSEFFKFFSNPIQTK